MEEAKVKTSRGWKNVLKIIIPYLIVVAVFEVIGALLCGIDIRHMRGTQQTTLQLFVMSFMSMIGTFCVVWFFTTKIDKKSFKSIGFERILVGKDMLLGLITGFVIMLSGFSILIATHQLQVVSIKPVFLDLLLSTGLFIVVAIGEEVFTRGYILRNLVVSFHKYVALFVSAFIFSIMHLANQDISLISLSIIFLSGLVLGLPYLFTKNLWFPIALHFSWNFFQGPIFGFNVSGTKTYKLIETNYTQANIWNGGKFGFEGSLIAVLFLAGALVVLYFLFRNRESVGQNEVEKNDVEPAVVEPAMES